MSTPYLAFYWLGNFDRFVAQKTPNAEEKNQEQRRNLRADLDIVRSRRRAEAGAQEIRVQDHSLSTSRSSLSPSRGYLSASTRFSKSLLDKNRKNLHTKPIKLRNGTFYDKRIPLFFCKRNNVSIMSI